MLLKLQVTFLIKFKRIKVTILLPIINQYQNSKACCSILFLDLIPQVHNVAVKITYVLGLQMLTALIKQEHIYMSNPKRGIKRHCCKTFRDCIEQTICWKQDVQWNIHVLLHNAKILYFVFRKCLWDHNLRNSCHLEQFTNYKF